MRIPVQTSFGLGLLPLPVTVEDEAPRGPRGGASERAREEAFYQGFPEGPRRDRVPGRLPQPIPQNPGAAPERRRLSEWKVFAGLLSLGRALSRRFSSLKWPARKSAPSHRS